MKLRIGDKLVDVDERGVLKATSISKPNKNGGTDVEIHIPCLKIMNKQPIKEEVDNGKRNL